MAETSIIGGGPYSVIVGYGLALDMTIIFDGLVKKIRDVKEFRRRYTEFLKLRGIDANVSHPLSVLAIFLHENLSNKGRKSTLMSGSIQTLLDLTKIRDVDIKVGFDDGIHVFLASSWWRTYMGHSRGRFDHSGPKPKKKDAKLLMPLDNPKWIHIMITVPCDSD
jgi:hypothetical protein